MLTPFNLKLIGVVILLALISYRLHKMKTSLTHFHEHHLVYLTIISFVYLLMTELYYMLIVFVIISYFLHLFVENRKMLRYYLEDIFYENTNVEDFVKKCKQLDNHTKYDYYELFNYFETKTLGQDNI